MWQRAWIATTTGRASLASPLEDTTFQCKSLHQLKGSCVGNCRTPLLYLHVVLSTAFKVRVEGQSRFQHRTAASVVGPADGKFLTIMTLGALRMRRTILKSNSLPLCTPRSMPPPPPTKTKKVQGHIPGTNMARPASWVANHSGLVRPRELFGHGSPLYRQSCPGCSRVTSAISS